MRLRARHSGIGTAATPAARLLAAAALIALCVLVPAPGLEAGDPQSPIERAIAFLWANQVKLPVDVTVNGARIVDFPGDWPQYFALRGDASLRVRDVSPFVVAFIHQALTGVAESHRRTLRLSAGD